MTLNKLNEKQSNLKSNQENMDEKNDRLTDRQEKILDIVIREYINFAQPISSKYLEKKYNLGICPASIRVEMQKLTDKGFISQPHTSAGRIPTDKGYRFFVDKLLKKESAKEKNNKIKIENWFEKEMANSINLLQLTAKNLALISSNLALAHVFGQDFYLKEGWSKVIKEPEFKKEKNISGFFEMIDNFEKEIEGLGNSSDEFSGLNILIGEENPFAKNKEFSIILSKCHFLNQSQGILAIFGPKRMNYDANISLLNSLINFLEKNNK